MSPNYYFDIDVLGGEDSGLSFSSLRALAFMKLHSRFKQTPGTYAISIPRTSRGRKLRVFATTQTEIVSVSTDFGSDRWVRDYVQIEAFKQIYSDYTGAWAAFARYRIPTAKSDRHAIDNLSALRDRRLAYAREKQLEFFNVRSSSTHQRFSLTVERIEGSSLPRDGSPNSYGLCSRLAPIALPDFP